MAKMLRHSFLVLIHTLGYCLKYKFLGAIRLSQ